MPKTYAVLTSGGDAPGMNAAIRAFAKICAGRGIRAVGVEHGYRGLMRGAFRELTREHHGELVSIQDIEHAGHLGGTLLGSARSERFRTQEGQVEALTHLATVDGLIVVGGNGSLTGAHALAARSQVPVVGVPASIDNDIGCTSTALGVDTALNTIVAACDRISDTARAHRRAFVVEVMGRQSGYLAMAASIASGADGVLMREQGRTESEIVDAVAGLVRRSFSDRRKQRVLVLKSEGVEMPCTRLVREVEARLADLEDVDIRATVLGHLVRGGNPSYQDRMIAGRLVFAALEAMERGITDQMVSWLPQQVAGGVATEDPAVQRFALSDVLEQTQALHDGTSAVTQWRVSRMRAVESTLAL